jgi:hypothetical protein
VPTIGNAHFAIDLQTLFAVLVFLSAVGGLLLLFCCQPDGMASVCREVPVPLFCG